MFSQIQSILDNKEKPYVGEEKVAALTAADRTHWANTRTKFFFKGINRQSLDAIEKSAFVVALDEVPYEYDPVSCLIFVQVKFVLNFSQVSKAKTNVSTIQNLQLFFKTS